MIREDVRGFLDGQALSLWVKECDRDRHDADHGRKEHEDAPLEHAEHR